MIQPMNTNATVPDPVAATADAPESLGAKWFFFTSLVFLLLGSLMLAGRPAFLLSPVLTGHGLSWLLLLLFGCGLPGVFGVVYWAIPKVFARPLYSEKFVFLHYAFHYAGFLLVLASVILPGFGRGEMGMTFIACGALALGINLARTFHPPSEPDVASAFLASSVLWLLVVALLGVPFSEKAPLQALDGTGWSAGWLVLALTGVLINLPMGIALRVTPFAFGSRVTKSGTPWYALVFSNAALAWMFSATVFGPPSFLLFCAGVYLVGVILYFARYFSVLQNRTVAALPWDGKILLTSFSLVPVAACMLMYSSWQHMQRAVASGQNELVSATPAGDETEVAAGVLPLEFFPVDGALVLTCILGIAVPAIVALGFGLVRIEKGRHASATAEFSARTRLAEQILLAAYFNYASGVLLIIPGAWLAIEQMVSLGSLFLVMGAVGFLGNAIFAGKAKPLGLSMPAGKIAETRSAPPSAAGV